MEEPTRYTLAFPVAVTMRINTYALALLAVLGAVSSGFADASPESIRTAIQSNLRNAALRFRAGVDDHGQLAALKAVYGAEANPLWVRDGHSTQQAAALVQELSAAANHGLVPGDYQAQLIAGLLEQMPRSVDLEMHDALVARFDVLLSSAALRFVSDLHFGRIDPAMAGFRLQTERPVLDLAATLTRLAQASDASAVVASVEPQFYHYKLLEQSLAQYRRLALAQASLPTLPDRPPRRARGETYYEGAYALRALLQLLGDLPAGESTAAPGSRLDPPLVAALKRFQARHGLDANGVLDSATLAALRTPLTRRVRQIELTLERWRWLPPFETPPIIVNIPQFRLFAFRSTADRKADILQMDVIVGRSFRDMQTPVFAADMRYVIFRPYWDVPYSITMHEMLPALRRNPRYLESQHLQIVRGDDDSAVVFPPSTRNLYLLAAGQLRLRQQPGRDNALGLVKFMLPNAYNVYLHSTPAQALFSNSRRAFSHGCIRVKDPVALAAHVLAGTPGDWTPERIQAAMNGTTTQRVNLARPIRVMILYATAMATEAGDTLFFDDLYGHDRRLEDLLDAAAISIRGEELPPPPAAGP